MSKGPGERLAARFRPAFVWGAEFTATGARLCAIAERDGKAAVIHAFSGPYPEAEAFAAARGLAFEGMHAAVSHLPCKLEPLAAAGEGSEEAAQVLERARPQGIPSEAWEARAFPARAGGCLAFARAETIEAFLKALPAPLAALWSLAPSPTALLPYVDPERAASPWAALLGEADALHVLFFRAGAFLAYIKVFSGWEEAGRDPASFARELKKALVYHFGSRFGFDPLAGLQIWRDGAAGEIGAALQGLGIARFEPDWGPLATVPPEFRVAAAVAWTGRLGETARDSAAPASFDVPVPEAATADRAWMRRGGKLVRYGVPVLAVLALSVALLGVVAGGIRIAVQAKARAWSGQLRRWDEVQKRQGEVEAELSGMRGLLARRTALYAELQSIARALPDETWLEAWESECAGGPRCRHRLEGFTTSEARVPEFLSALSAPGGPGPMRLKATEKIKGEVVEQKTGIAANKRDLVRFQLGTGP